MKDIRSFIYLIKQYMEILTPVQKIWGGVVFGLSLCGAALELIGVSAIMPLVQALIAPEDMLKNKMVQYACSMFKISETDKIVRFVFIGIVLIYVFKNIFLIFLAYVKNRYSLKVNRELSIRIINSYLDRGYPFFRKNNIGILLRGCTGAVAQTEGVLFNLFQLLSEVLTATFIVIYLFFSDLNMTLVIMAFILICLLIVLVGSKKSVKGAGKKYFDYMALANQRLLELFYGIKEIFASAKENVFLRKYKSTYMAQQRADAIKSIYVQAPPYVVEALCVTGMITALYLKSLSSPADLKLFVPNIAVFAMAAFRLLPSVGRISSYLNSIMYATPSVNEVYSGIKEVKAVERKYHNTKLSTDDDRLVRFKNEIKLNDVSFAYPDAEENVIDHISLVIKRGEAIGIVGSSGAGKSTLADIILGLLEPCQGTILMDGLNIREHRVMWANNVGYVPQSVYLMDNTIRRNIVFGDEDTSIDESKVNEVLRDAQMFDFVQELPEGLDTMIGERGVRLSGGQAQRLALARALYHNPEILILDEATSALDNETENAVMEAIDALQGQKTMIIIAHRLTTIRKCDRIYEIKDGKAYERKYEDLISE